MHMLSELKIVIAKTESYRISDKKYKSMQKYDKTADSGFCFLLCHFLCRLAPIGERTAIFMRGMLPVGYNSLFQVVAVVL